MKTLLKKAYSAIPYKQQLYTGLKKFWIPGESLYKHLHFEGKFKVEIDKKRSFWMNHYGFRIENEIFWAGLENGWEKESFKLWIALCREAEYIFDIGANTGIFSLISKTVTPHSKVYAFEPVKRVFSKLEENMRLNQFDVQCFEEALSDTDGWAIIFDSDAEHVLSVTVNKNLTPKRKTKEVKIPIKRLDTFIEKNNIPRIDLMKIDVETHEPEVLTGMGKYLQRFQPILLIEILNEEVGKKVNQLVEGLDYLFFNINEDGGIRQVDTIGKSDYYNFLFCKEDTAKKLKLIP